MLKQRPISLMIRNKITLSSAVAPVTGLGCGGVDSTCQPVNFRVQPGWVGSLSGPHEAQTIIHAHVHTYGWCRVTLVLLVGGELDYPERTHTDTGRARKCHTEGSQAKKRTLLWGDSVNHCITVSWQGETDKRQNQLRRSERLKFLSYRPPFGDIIILRPVHCLIKAGLCSGSLYF